MRAALKYRVAVVLAPAGSGKTTAVRAAISGVAHVWYDAANLVRDELVAAASSGDRLIVVDGVHASAAGAMRPDEIAKLVERSPATRWVFISRQSAGLPLATWIAGGEAGAPVGQSDLALSPPEILRSAKMLSLRVDDAAMQFLIDVSRGWPVAVRFALAALQRSPLDLSRAAATARRLLGEYFTTEILEPLDRNRRELLAEFALLGSFDESMLTAFGA